MQVTRVCPLGVRVEALERGADPRTRHVRHLREPRTRQSSPRAAVRRRMRSLTCGAASMDGVPSLSLGSNTGSVNSSPREQRAFPLAPADDALPLGQAAPARTAPTARDPATTNAIPVQIRHRDVGTPDPMDTGHEDADDQRCLQALPGTDDEGADHVDFFREG